MIEIKRNCSSSIKDGGDRLTFGDFTIRFTDDEYIQFMEFANTRLDRQDALASVITEGLKAVRP